MKVNKSLLREGKKLRYPKNLTIEMFRTIIDAMKKHKSDIDISLCKEQPEIWKALGLLTFAAIVTMILFIPFAFRSLEEPIYKIGILTNKLLMVGVVATFLLTLGVMYIPFFQKIFEFTTLSPADWIIPLSAALVALIFAEFIKMITRNI